jgi:hypothetical protein
MDKRIILMLEISISPVSNQSLNITLNEQNCTIKIYLLSTGLFFDLAKDNDPIVTGVICQNLNPLVRKAYTGFIGDLVFFDTQGIDDPVYTGLGNRFLLLYLEPSDLEV